MKLATNSYNTFMPENKRVLKIENLDILPINLVKKTVDFFNQQYPSESNIEMNTNFFFSKLDQSNPNGSGYFTVATYEGEVVGSCTAVRKTLIANNRLISAVEIGDTYTSNSFRRSCIFTELYAGTSTQDEYLNKSIFGRLATETLDRARADGVEYVYGTPNLQAKLSWLGKMNFKLVDGGFTYRISSASLTHPLYNSSKMVHLIAHIYYKLSLFFCFFTIKKYSMSLISKDEIDDLSESPVESSFGDDIHLVNSSSWIKYRFVNNVDKEYKIIKIERRSDSRLCGYLFFLEREREDNFKLLILSKDLFYDRKLESLKIPLSRIASEMFFKYENLSIWVDTRKMSLKYRALFGFLSKAMKVDIVGKGLTDKGAELETRKFSSFQYGDSDLG